jgi:hypothetical protein
MGSLAPRRPGKEKDRDPIGAVRPMSDLKPLGAEGTQPSQAPCPDRNPCASTRQCQPASYVARQRCSSLLLGEQAHNRRVRVANSQVRVHLLDHAQAAVPDDLRDQHRVHPTPQSVSDVRVSQGVWADAVNVQAGALRSRTDQLLDTAHGQRAVDAIAAAPQRQEQALTISWSRSAVPPSSRRVISSRFRTSDPPWQQRKLRLPRDPLSLLARPGQQLPHRAHDAATENLLSDPFAPPAS